MKFTNGFKKIESPYSWVSSIFEMVFNGEETNKDSFYIGACDGLINEQEGNYKDNYGVDYKLTENQKEKLRKRYIKLEKEEGLK